MRRFAALFDALDATTKTNRKLAALEAYFASAPPEDAAWALFFLSGRRLKRHVSSSVLFDAAVEESRLPAWLLGESYDAVGDLAELVSLVVSRDGASSDVGLARFMDERVLPLRDIDDDEQRRRIRAWWGELDRTGTLVLGKILTGELRVGVSATLVARAVARVAQVEPAVIGHRLMGPWEPTGDFLRALVARGTETDASRPFPFYLASPLEDPVASLGERAAWLAEWKWDGIRAQVVRRESVWIWSRGEEDVTDRFPEIREAARLLPAGTVLDGEVLAVREGRPLPFASLQRRIGRKDLGGAILEESPAGLIAFDLLEDGGRDIRALPLRERRARLERLLPVGPVIVSPALDAPTWDDVARARATSRERGVEGVMLKRLDGAYRAGRPRGEQWKWKIDPFSIDAVLVYSQPGHGRRASLFTDHTFAVWRESELVPVAKAYSGVSDDEMVELDRWIRDHTIEKRGPVRVVEPVHVFELHFEAIASSQRHRGGIAVRFPRIARWRRDKPAREADTLSTLEKMMEAQPRAEPGPDRQGSLF
jgi:DNA ligase-1